MKYRLCCDTAEIGELIDIPEDAIIIDTETHDVSSGGAWSKTYTGCGLNVFDFYIPGSKEAPGKLLDMCRALHAEEITLLKLAKNYGKTSDNMVLYVTTQPCNLCSNKVVLAGIKKVVYAEPYSIKEAEEILRSGKVEAIRFEGVKSSAYFRLYQ